MILDIRIIDLNGTFNADSPKLSITFSVISDDWRDGPVAIAIQGTSEQIMDSTGKVLGWLPRGQHYDFGNDIDYGLLAADVEVGDRKVLDADDEYTLHVLDMKRNNNRSALIRWTVTQNFTKWSAKNDTPGNGNENGDPSESDMGTLDCSKEYYDVPFVRDARTGKLILNSAGDPFTPTPAMRRAIRGFVFTRREKKNRLSLYEQYENVVNSDTWHGASPGTVLMESILPKWDGNVFNVTYSFKYKADGWGEKYLDTGLRKLITENETKKRVPIMGDENAPIDSPVKLDGKGGVLADDDAGVDIPNGNEFFWKYNEMAFAPLAIPNPYTMEPRQ